MTNRIMEANEKVYASQQLICMLPPIALKVMLYLLNWQKMPQIKYYEKQMCKLMHISKSELELAMQTLIDNHLITVSKDGDWLISINKETVKRYFNVKMEAVSEHEGIKLSSDITWNKEDDSTLDSLSDEQLEKMIKELQRRKQEKKGCQVIYANASSNDDVIDSLPW